MKEKAKGFTLIELIAVIAILGLIALIVYPAITSVIRNSRESAYNDQVNVIVKAAKEWSIDNANTLPDDGTIYREIWRQKEEGTYTVSDDGKVITATLIKQTTSTPLSDDNPFSSFENDQFYLEIVYTKIDEYTMSVEYSSTDDTAQNSKTIYKY